MSRTTPASTPSAAITGHAARVGVLGVDEEVGGRRMRHDPRLAVVERQLRLVGALRVGGRADAVEHRVAGRLERRGRGSMPDSSAATVRRRLESRGSVTLRRA